jgi:hypothetical protein
VPEENLWDRKEYEHLIAVCISDDVREDVKVPGEPDEEDLMYAFVRAQLWRHGDDACKVKTLQQEL